MTAKDIRWIQRFNNFEKAFGKLSEAVQLAKERALTELEKQGLIQAFEYTHELAWKTLKDFLESRGVQTIYGSKDTSREAFKAGLIQHGEIWMEMILSRNLAMEAFEEETADELNASILHSYHVELKALRATFTSLKESEDV
ncbi:MAG: nucleotidyltransferase substrate binding protein [Acidobacteriota bacterium]